MDSKETLIRIVLVALLLYAAGCLAGLGSQLRTADAQTRLLSATLAAVERENLAKSQKLEDGWHTEDWEALARRRLGLVKPGEIVFLFPEEEEEREAPDARLGSGAPEHERDREDDPWSWKSERYWKEK